MEVEFKDLANAELIVDCIYKGGTKGDLSDEVLHKLLPKCGNSSGFRKVSREDDPTKMAYVVLYTSMAELEWPDYLDRETGIFRYYGDKRNPGIITDTKQGGNKLLEKVFELLHSKKDLTDIPPFLIFRKIGFGRDVQFLGLAVPGNPEIPPGDDLIAFWRTINNNRFQNYESYFTILNTGTKPISKEWLNSLIHNHKDNLEYAPDVWKEFVKNGRNGIKALKAPLINRIPTSYEQLQSDIEGKKCIERVINHYRDNSYGFEACAVDIVKKMDSHFERFSLTRPWRDGGRDATGFYMISAGGDINFKLSIDCALEAKCYSFNHGVGVREMSRLISRIRYRQFGIMITTSFVNPQAYKEVVEDGHPILIITATDIASILRRNQIFHSQIDTWLNSVDNQKYDFGS